MARKKRESACGMETMGRPSRSASTASGLSRRMALPMTTRSGARRRGGRGRSPRGLDAGPFEEGAHGGIERAVGAAHAMALLLQQAGERSHPRPTDRHAVDVELWRVSGFVIGFLVLGARSVAFPELSSTSKKEQDVCNVTSKTAILALCAAAFWSRPARLAAPRPASRRPSSPSRSRTSARAKGDKIIHDFVIKNDGDADLQITNVQPACGCTVASFDKVIKPGADRQGARGGRHVDLQRPDRQGGHASSPTIREHPQIELTIQRQGRALHLGQAGLRPLHHRPGRAAGGEHRPDAVGAGRHRLGHHRRSTRRYPVPEGHLPRGQARGAAPRRQGQAVEGGDEALEQAPRWDRSRTT